MDQAQAWHSERLLVTGWLEPDGRLPEFLLARRALNRRLLAVGTASLRLHCERRTLLLDALREQEIPGRRPRNGT
jgi:hypothetical protein